MNNEELRPQYNPEGSELRRNQLEMLKILQCVHQICEKHHIDYWLASGTLLGAVRHGGFIPWDDDCDIEIMYADKRRFIEACKKDLPQEYIIQCHETDNLYCQNILKVRHKDSFVQEVRRFENQTYPVKYNYNGVFIDVFTEEPSTKFLLKLAKLPIRVMNLAQYKWRFTPRLLSMLFHLNNGIYALLRLFAQMNPFCKYYYHSYGSWFMSRRVKKELLPTQEILFEGYSFKAPHDTHQYLTRLYGDYMKLPDDKDRAPSHNVPL